MAKGTDGRYYGEAEFDKAVAEKFAAQADGDKPKTEEKTEEQVVEPPKQDTDPVRDDAGTTVPLTEDPEATARPRRAPR